MPRINNLTPLMTAYQEGKFPPDEYVGFYILRGDDDYDLIAVFGTSNLSGAAALATFLKLMRATKEEWLVFGGPSLDTFVDVLVVDPELEARAT